jgi:putative hemolysin
VENLYCKYLGYELKYQEGTNKFVVVLPNSDEVNPRDFYMGKIGQEYSYCALKGYKIMQKGIDGWEHTYKYPVCY